jgi:hypothetical protein
VQTTLRIDDTIYREAKAAAARQGITLTRFIEESLKLSVQRATGTPSFSSASIPSYSSAKPLKLSPRDLKNFANQEQEKYDTGKLNPSGHSVSVIPSK